MWEAGSILEQLASLAGRPGCGQEGEGSRAALFLALALSWGKMSTLCVNFLDTLSYWWRWGAVLKVLELCLSQL